MICEPGTEDLIDEDLISHEAIAMTNHGVVIGGCIFKIHRTSESFLELCYFNIVESKHQKKCAALLDAKLKEYAMSAQVDYIVHYSDPEDIFMFKKRFGYVQ